VKVTFFSRNFPVCNSSYKLREIWFFGQDLELFCKLMVHATCSTCSHLLSMTGKGVPR